jgi:hypothetical protein
MLKKRHFKCRLTGGDQSPNNAAIMNNADYWQYKTNYKERMGKEYNGVYIATMQKYFGNRPATSTYNISLPYPFNIKRKK